MTQADESKSAQPNESLVPFWQRRWVVTKLPLATSVFFHLSVFIVAAVVVPSLVHVLKDVSKEQVVIPDTNLGRMGRSAGFQIRGWGEIRRGQRRQENDPNMTNSHSWAHARATVWCRLLNDTSRTNLAGDARSCMTIRR